MGSTGHAVRSRLGRLRATLGALLALVLAAAILLPAFADEAPGGARAGGDTAATASSEVPAGATASSEVPAGATPAGDEEVDRLALAALLVRDGAWLRAASVLRELDPAQKDLDLGRYHLLHGLVDREMGRPKLAAQHLAEAIAAGHPDPKLHLFLAQSRFDAGDANGTLEALASAPPEVREEPAAYLLEAAAWWQTDQKARAWGALSAGRQRFPEHEDIARQSILLLVDMGLFKEAGELGRLFLARADATADDHVLLAEALRRGGQLEEAGLLLEEGRLRFPESKPVATQLARTWLDADKPLAAASVLEQAAMLHPELTVEAAELYRRGGRLARALLLNAQVVDQTEKVRQRLGLLVEMERFDAAGALGPRLERLGLASEDPIAYALAYAAFRTGRFDEAEHWLGGISDPELFERAVALRRAMDACRGVPGGCS